MKEVVCGVDLGSWSFKVCAFDWKTFEVLTNEANFRETPALVAYAHSHRQVGEEARNKLTSNFANTVRAPLRLVGLERDYAVIEEELRDCTARYEVEDQLALLVGERGQRVSPEELVAALLGGVRRMLATHQMAAEALYLALPSYLSHHERRTLQRCAEIAAAARTVHIVDDWVCIASEYSFTRVKELAGAQGTRVVLFVDAGYARTSAMVVEFGGRESRLLDCEHLPFAGARAMDRELLEFYDRHYKRVTGSEDSLFSSPRARAKLSEEVDKQRRVLSANLEHQLHVESLLDDTDLTYSLTRSDFEGIVAPVLAHLAEGLNALKSRMPHHLRLHSIELLGGASRIPCLRGLVEKTFGMEASKTLNQSEAMVHGCTIFGAKEAGLFFYDYSVPNVNLVDVVACWHYGGGSFLGEEEGQYKHRQVVFGCGAKLPAENVVSFASEGPVEMFVYYAQAISRKAIAYVRFHTPNRVRFSLSGSKIVGAELESGAFAVCKFYQRREEWWAGLRGREGERVRHEDRLRRIYDLKNQYEAKLYAFKDSLHQYRHLINEPELASIDSDLARSLSWIESEHTRPLGSEEDLHLYTLKVSEISSSGVLDNLAVRKRNIDQLVHKYTALRAQLEAALQAVGTDHEPRARKLHLLLRWLVESFASMKDTHWEGYYLTLPSLDFAAEELIRIQNAA